MHFIPFLHIYCSKLSVATDGTVSQMNESEKHVHIFESTVSSPFSLWKYQFSLWKYSFSLWKYPFSLWKYPFSLWKSKFSLWKYLFSLWKSPFSLWKYPFSGYCDRFFRQTFWQTPKLDTLDHPQKLGNMANMSTSRNFFKVKWIHLDTSRYIKEVAVPIRSTFVLLLLWLFCWSDFLWAWRIIPRLVSGW